MSDSQFDFDIKHPVSVWNRELKIEPRSFFKSLGKSIISMVERDAGGVADNMLEALTDVSKQDKPAQAAWLLIYRALCQAIADLIEDYKDLFYDVDENTLNEKNIEEIATQLAEAMEKLEVGINSNFFDRPQDLALLDEIQPALSDWLQELGLQAHQINAFQLRLKHKIVSCLHNEWRENADKYACIEDAIKSPFMQANNEQRQWMLYNNWLQEQVNERMFDEAFGLSQVYVPLRAYYEEKPKKTDIDEKTSETGNEKTKRFVVDLHSEMEHWLTNFDVNNAIRVICGGPGSGKSSFAKMFAAQIARVHQEIPVLFIPLHHFNLNDNLLNGVEHFIKGDYFLSGNPLDPQSGKKRLILIFDGLDELSMQGKAATETAMAFVDEVISQINRFNDQSSQRQVIITGRDVAIQSASQRFRSFGQVLHVLPYYLSEEETSENNSYEYVDAEKLLNNDQRQRWWKNYGQAKNLTYQGVPEKLDIETLSPITREPLLNYLIALSFERGRIDFDNETTLNEIYEDLLQAVYDRQWEKGRQHKHLTELSRDQFFRILEEIALAVWHGDGRTATVEKIYKRCAKSNLIRYLQVFQEGTKQGVTRLLTAFYFRQSDQLQDGERSFEFTHKSFAEYLTARRILRHVQRIHEELQRHTENPDAGYDEKDALVKWIEVCGPTNIDEYIYSFLDCEIACYNDAVSSWQCSFASLLGYAVRNCLPMEHFNKLTFKQALGQSRNAEEAILIIHYLCAKQTEDVVNIDWGEETNLGDWITRVYGQHIPGRRLLMKCLGFLRFSYCQLSSQNLRNIIAKNAVFYKTPLFDTDFSFANLEFANLDGVQMWGVKFTNANLVYASFRGSSMIDANLFGATAYKSNFESATLIEANFSFARLNSAKLISAILYDANFRYATLKYADFTGAALSSVDLTYADLSGANLSGADLSGANLTNATLDDAKMTDAIFNETIMPDGSIRTDD